MSRSITADGTRRVSIAIAALIGLALALLAANVRGSPLRSADLVTTVSFAFPVAISVLVYCRFAKAVVWWEIALLVAWAALAVAVGVFVGFLATMDAHGTGGYPGPAMELLRNAALFFAGTVGLGVPYAVAGTYRATYPYRSVGSALFAGVLTVILIPAAAIAL